MPKKLKAAKNIRKIYPCCCATCEYLESGDDIWTCKRPNGQEFAESGLHEDLHYFTVCDRYRRAKWAN